MNDYPIGTVLSGNRDEIERAYERFAAQPVDETRLHTGPYPYSMFETTLGGRASASGPGTYEGHPSTLTFAPCAEPGWWIDRTDQPEQFPIPVSVRSVWNTHRNIVLRSGSAHNYLRMVEHIVAMKVGLGLDRMTVETASGDPPLFDLGNYDLVEAVDRATMVETTTPASFFTVGEPVTFGLPGRGDFLTFLPAEPGRLGLRVDCAVDFPSAIGKQRILFDVTPETFRHGATARTNAPLRLLVYVKTVGKLFADTRHLGYTSKNILIHGRRRYFNEPKLLHDGKSLEAVWHRATLDLLAAVALLDGGRFCGTIVSYRSGHTQDVRLCTLLERKGLLVPAAMH